MLLWEYVKYFMDRLYWFDNQFLLVKSHSKQMLFVMS